MGRVAYMCGQSCFAALQFPTHIYLLISTPVTRSPLLTEFIYSRSSSTAKAIAKADGIDSGDVAVGDIMSRSKVCG